MNDALQVELQVLQSAVRTAYTRFMIAGELRRRHGLSESERSKADNIHFKAFAELTESLARMHELHEALNPSQPNQPDRKRAPRYSTDARRDNSTGM